MSRVIVAAALIFAAAALVLHKAIFDGPFTEPALLVTMGSFFLLAAKVCGTQEKIEHAHDNKVEPMLVAERHRASA